MRTPKITRFKFTKTDDSPYVDQTTYISMIGSLIYLIASRPDSMHHVCLVARFQSSPKESHVMAIKRIFRYIQGTLDYGIWYPKHDDFRFVTYIESDWAGCLDERKSTSGTTFSLGNKLVCWHSKKHESTTLSTIEVEYIAPCSCYQQVLWMVQTLSDMKVTVSKPVLIYCDNQSAISISKNTFTISRTKHIDVCYIL